jgi:hypothetical protein
MSSQHWCADHLRPWDFGEPDDQQCPKCGTWHHFGDAFPLDNAWRPMSRLAIWWRRKRGALGNTSWSPDRGRHRISSDGTT